MGRESVSGAIGAPGLQCDFQRWRFLLLPCLVHSSVGAQLVQICCSCSSIACMFHRFDTKTVAFVHYGPHILYESVGPFSETGWPHVPTF